LRFAVVRAPIVHFGRESDDLRGNVVDEAGALDAEAVEQAEKLFRVSAIALDVGIVLAPALHQIKRRRLHHAIRHDMDVDVYDRLQGFASLEVITAFTVAN
jgi:hypothetical protein